MGVEGEGNSDLLGDSVGVGETTANGQTEDNQINTQGDTSTDDKSENKSDDSVTTEQTSSNDKPAWMAQLPADQKDSESLAKFSNIGDLGKAYSELEGKLGDTVTVPGDSASDDERSAFYKKLGRPETPDGYKVQFPQSYSTEVVNAYRATAHEQGLNDAQLGGFMKTMGLQALKTLETMQATHESTVAAGVESLKKDWGDNYDNNFKLVARTITNYGGETLLKDFKSAGLSNNPAVAKFLAAVGNDLLEHKVIDGKVGGKGRSSDRLYYD